jgi:hypothetical protein
VGRAGTLAPAAAPGHQGVPGRVQLGRVQLGRVQLGRPAAPSQNRAEKLRSSRKTGNRRVPAFHSEGRR